MGRANIVKSFKSPVIIEQTRQLIKYLKNNGGIIESTEVFEFFNESDNFHDICAMLMGANVLEEIHGNDKTFLKLKYNAPKSTVEVQTGHERVCGIIEMNRNNKQRKIHCRHCKKQYPLHNWHIYTDHFHQEHMDHLQVYHMNSSKFLSHTFIGKTKKSNTATSEDLTKTQTDSMDKTKVCQNIMPISCTQVNNILNSMTDAIPTKYTQTNTETNKAANFSTSNFRPGTQHEALKCSHIMSENVGPELKRLKIEGTRFPITVTEFLKIQKNRLQSSESTNQSVGNELETLNTTNLEQQVHFTLNKSPQLAAKVITSNGLKPTQLPPEPSVTLTKSFSEPKENIKINTGKGANGLELGKPNTIVHLNTTSANSVEQNPSNSYEVSDAQTILPNSQPSERSNDTPNAPVDYEKIIPRCPVSETEEKDATKDKAQNDVIRNEVESAKSKIVYITRPQCSNTLPILKMPIQFIHVKPKTVGTTTTNINTPTTMNTLKGNKANSKLNIIHTMPQRKYPNIQPKPTTSDNYENELPTTTPTTNHNAVKSKVSKSTASVMPNLPITSKQIKYATAQRPVASSNINILPVNTQGIKRAAPIFSSTSNNSKMEWNAKSVYGSLKEHQSSTSTFHTNSKEQPRIPPPKTRSEIVYTQRVKEGTPLYVNLKEPKSPSDDFRKIYPPSTKFTEQNLYINLKEPESSSEVESSNSLDKLLLTRPDKTNVLNSKEPQRNTSIYKIPSGITIKRVPARSPDGGTTNSISKIIAPNNSCTSNGSNAALSKSPIIKNTEILPIKIVNVQSINNSNHESSLFNNDPHFEFVSSGGINGRNKNDSSYMRFDYSDDEYVNDDNADYCNENIDYNGDNHNNDDDYNDGDDHNNDDEDDYGNGDASNMRFEYSDDNDDGFIIEL